ncbi:MAG: hypothetical protein JXA60_09925 [Candidatus Coatesbacteria bacterium]|nr:hypothetical protein [Candidatus Coatesbacteria bacterium]
MYIKTFLLILLVLLLSFSCIKLNKQKLKETVGDNIYSQLGLPNDEPKKKEEPPDTATKKNEPPDTTQNSEKVKLTDDDVKMLVKKSNAKLNKLGVMNPEVKEWKIKGAQGSRVILLITLEYKDRIKKTTLISPLNFSFINADKEAKNWIINTVYK